MRRLDREPLKIVLLYLVAGFLWISFSDQVLFAVVHDQAAQQWLAIAKGWLYVLVTGLLLFYLLRQLVAKLERIEAQAWQAQKMEAMGRMAAAIAHDMNNVLGAIQATAELGADELGPAHPQRAALEQILAASDRGRDLVRQLMAFARQQAADPREVKLDDLLLARQGLLRKLCHPGVQFDLVLEAKAPAVLADPVQLEQVLMNLVANANDAMPEGGRLRVGLRCQGRWAELAVQDSGTGMDDQTKAHLFEPFYTTKAPGVGTGLGLATVYGIVQQYNGEVLVDSAPGQGSTFTVRLPRLA
ncbi:MAG TPA: ATP-binding protein [bacterium]|jgi:two-component system cell cycle sensor histidine kinase/response regulator CckA|nr:ATP-binding protein [bacterium]HXB98008.1 ATP-binding protein [bacterium]